MGREAGNHGKMYFIGPQSDYGEEIRGILTPISVNVHSTFMGVQVYRAVINFIGKIPEGATVYRKQTTIFIAPTVQNSANSQ